jgi:hypothetical protein
MNSVLVTIVFAVVVVSAAIFIRLALHIDGQARTAQLDRVRDLSTDASALEEAAVASADDVALTLSGDNDHVSKFGDHTLEVDSASVVGPALYWTADVLKSQKAFYVKHHELALRQQQATFWASLATGALSAALIIIGVTFAMFLGTSVGVVTSVAGTLPGAISGLLFWQSKAAEERANKNLQQLTLSLERSTAIIRCLQIAQNIRDQATRERIVATASLLSAFPDASFADLTDIMPGGATHKSQNA